jgi:hypothetical protein
MDFSSPLVEMYMCRWLYGELGCQLYATAGMFLGIGIIFSLGLLILDRYLQLVREFFYTFFFIPTQ